MKDHDESIDAIFEAIRRLWLVLKSRKGRSYWIPGVNNNGRYGRWAFAEFTEVFKIEDEFNKLIDRITAEKG